MNEETSRAYDNEPDSLIQLSTGSLLFTIEQASEGILWFDAEKRVIYANQAAEQLLARTKAELVGFELDLPLDISPNIVTLLHPERGFFSAELSAIKPPPEVGITLIVFLRDLTAPKRENRQQQWPVENERRSHRRFEYKERQTDRLNSLTAFASGLAHQFNNLLMVIMGNTSSARGRVPSNSLAVESLDSIERAARQAVEIVGYMSLFSGSGPMVPQRVNLSELIRKMQNIIAASARRATVEFNLQPDLPLISADISQLKQSAILLISRAAANLPDRRGFIGVTTGTQFCSEGTFDAAHNFSTGPGEYVYLQISDTGEAIDEEARQRLFEPFADQNSFERGLGMAAVLGCVRAHRGAIEVLSSPGSGTTIELFFPVSDTTANPHVVEEKQVEGWRGSGTLLVVDDDEEVRNLLMEMCRGLGFNVLTAIDGADCLRIYAENREQISLVLLDFMMPNMGGDEVTRRLRILYPEVKIVISSGYFASVITPQLRAQGLEHFLQKPYTIAELTKTLQAVLNS